MLVYWKNSSLATFRGTTAGRIEMSNNTTAKVAPSVSDVQKMFASLFSEIETATGKSGRARFSGFGLMVELKDVIERAIKLLEDGDLVGAMKSARNAKSWLWNSERKFCQNSLDVLDRKIGKLRVEPDLFKMVAEAREAFASEVALVADPKTTNLAKASSLHWALYESIDRADREQTDRVKLKDAEKEAQRKAKRDLREARLEANRKAAEGISTNYRVGVAHTIAEQFAALVRGGSSVSL